MYGAARVVFISFVTLYARMYGVARMCICENVLRVEHKYRAPGYFILMFLSSAVVDHLNI